MMICPAFKQKIVKGYQYPILLILMIGVLNPLQSGALDTLWVLYTNNTNGALENCYCPEHPLGAVEKRAAFVDSFRQIHPQNTVVVEAGDFLSLAPQPIRDSLLCEAYGIVGYDAILPGDQEWSRSTDVQTQILPRTQASIIHGNVRRPVIPGSVTNLTIKREEWTIGIAGIVSPEVFKYYPDSVKDRIELGDPVQDLTQSLKNMQDQGDVILVLSHSGYAADRHLAESLPASSVAAIIGGHSQTVVDSLVVINDIIIAQAGRDGYYVGILMLVQDEQGTLVERQVHLEPMTLNRSDHPQVMRLIEEYERRTGRINRRKLRWKSGE